MKRLVIISIVLLITGCGSRVMDPPSARERVTPAMREACPFGLDSEIAGKITLFDTLREEGLSKLEALALSGEVCGTDDPLGEILCGTDPLCLGGIQSLCNACNAAVIDAVWPSGVGSPPADEQPENQAPEQPLPEESQPEPTPEPEPEPDLGDVDPPLKPGIYIGNLLCDTIQTVAGFSNTVIDSVPVSLTISNHGLPVFEGQEIFVGLVLTFDAGFRKETETVTEITESNNGLVMSFATEVSLCADSCALSRDGICDEIVLCGQGTDCTDCGTFVFEVTGSRTYIAAGADEIRRVSNELGSDRDGLFFFTRTCEGVLTK